MDKSQNNYDEWKSQIKRVHTIQVYLYKILENSKWSTVTESKSVDARECEEKITN